MVLSFWRLLLWLVVVYVHGVTPVAQDAASFSTLHDDGSTEDSIRLSRSRLNSRTQATDSDTSAFPSLQFRREGEGDASQTRDDSDEHALKHYDNIREKRLQSKDREGFNNMKQDQKDQNNAPRRRHFKPLNDRKVVRRRKNQFLQRLAADRTENVVESVSESSSLLEKHSWHGTSKALVERLCHVKGAQEVCYKHGMASCVCQGGLADCSGKPFRPNLSYIPKLPAKVTCLLFRYNNNQHLTESYFHNVSHFQVIDFSYNNLLSISDATFTEFDGRLKYLILNYNIGFKYKYVQRVLKYPPTLRLDLVNIKLQGSDMPAGFFKPFANNPTEELILDYNFFQELDLREFSVLKNITFLSFAYSNVQNVITATASFPKLTGLDLNGNIIISFPETCSSSSSSSSSTIVSNTTGNTREDEDGTRQSSAFPKLKMVYLNVNNITHFPSNACLPSVGLLGLTRNNISSLESYSFANLTSLKVLYLDQMAHGLTSIAANAFASKSIIELHVSKNNIDFSSPSISSRLFHGCTSLEVLYAAKNNMSRAQPEHFSDLFVIPNLKSLYLSSCHLRVVPSDGLSQLKKLNRLYLYVNEISSLPEAAFDSLTSLQYLRLDQNLIERVRANVFSKATLKRLLKIDLSANNFQCNCDILWFKQWLVKKGAEQFDHFPGSYTCANLPRKRLIDFSISAQACFYSRSTYIVFVVLLSICLTGFLVFVLIFRYRWHIRLAFYEWRHRAAYDQLEEDGEYQYDVFIVHCNDDADWVLDQLLVRVEDQWGHRACVHQRDFQAGGSIINNTVRALNLSRRVVVVLSSSFAQSNWCTVELMLCQTYAIDHDLPHLLVLQLEAIRTRDMTPMMVALRNTTTFLEWPAEEAQEDLFWRRLKRCVDAMRGRRRGGQGVAIAPGRAPGEGRGGAGGGEA